MECLWVFWNQHPMLFYDTWYHPTHSFTCTEFGYHCLSTIGLSVWLHIFHNSVLSPLFIKCANHDDLTSVYFVCNFNSFSKPSNLVIMNITHESINYQSACISGVNDKSQVEKVDTCLLIFAYTTFHIIWNYIIHFSNVQNSTARHPWISYQWWYKLCLLLD